MTVDPQAWEKSLSSLGSQLVEALKPVAAKLGVAAEHMYRVMVRQAVAEAVAAIVGWGVVVTFLAVLSSRIRTYGKEEEKPIDAEFVRGVSYVPLAIACIIAAVVLASYLPDLVNPEYSAIKTLIDAVSKGACK